MAQLAPAGWKDSHPDELPAVPAPTPTQTVAQRACRSAWAKLIAKLYEVDLIGGSPSARERAEARAL